ncbi:MAG: transposase [Dehalococcoidia bacterium]|nr:transposase [Dehalococcoidia bacterium]
MSKESITGRLLYLRLERNGLQPVDLYFFTTLLDASLYTAPELVHLYGNRWHVELNLRYVKATLDMDLLAGKSVDVVRKELCAGMLAYNLIRTFISLAAQGAGLSPLVLSFTKCWRRIHDKFAVLRPTTTTQHIAEKIERLLS